MAVFIFFVWLAALGTLVQSRVRWERALGGVLFVAGTAIFGGIVLLHH